MDRHKRVLTVALTSMIGLLAGCQRGADGSLDLKGTFYPLDLALACDQSTPSPLRSEYPGLDFANARGNVCVERNSVANSLHITQGDIHKDEAFREPVYELQLHIDRKDQGRMEKGMSKAIRSKRALVLIVHGAVVARAFLMSLPEDGVISMGGYDSVDEAKTVAERFEVPPPHR